MAQDASGPKTGRRRRAKRGARVEPATTRSFSESSPDGFADDRPEWVSYCPDCGAKLPAKDHEECPFFCGKESDAEGTMTAVACAYGGRPRRREPGQRAAPAKRRARKAR
jgi:hypothetical protein